MRHFFFFIAKKLGHGKDFEKGFKLFAGIIGATLGILAIAHTFAACAACAVGSHLAFTVAFDETYATPTIKGKLVSGIFSVALALLLHNRCEK